MRSTLYEALGIDVNSDEPTIRAALRAVLRRFWSTPRDASGDNEEAVRFVALASGVLCNEDRRDRYDASMRAAGNNNPWRGEVLGGNVSGGTSISRGAVVEEVSNVEEDDFPQSGAHLLPIVPALANPLPEASNWADAYVFAAALSAVLLLIGCAWFALSESLGAWVAIGVGVIGFAVCAAAAFTMKRDADEAVSSLSHLAITKWRREGSVFVGNPPPQQDTAWIFRLRVMELTRSAAGYSSVARIGARLLARAVDYALIALVAVLLIGLLARLLPAEGALWTTVWAVLRSPIALPAIVVLLGIPYDAFFTSRWRTTPGKWLVGVVVVSGVTYDASQRGETNEDRANKRARSFATDAMALGFWPLALLRASAQMQTVRATESSWDAKSDSIVVVRDAPRFARAAALAICLGVLMVLIAVWSADFKRVLAWVTATATSAVETTKQTISAALPDTPPPTPVQTQTPVTEPASSLPVIPALPGNALPRQAGANGNLKSNNSTTNASANAPVAGGNPALNAQVESQAKAAQARRARIDRTMAQVDAARQRGSYAGLQGACKQWTDDEPGNGQAWRCLGMAQFQAGAGRDALPALRQALKIEPNDAAVESAILQILRP
jgi:hypothetical protein